MGVSLGKVNYGINGLIEKGWIKAQNFRNNQNKLARLSAYPSGIESKATITVRFLRQKMDDYKAFCGNHVKDGLGAHENFHPRSLV